MTGISSPERGAAAERILLSAADLFARFGYNGVSTRDIASGAGVNEVTIYRHYPRKRDLYLAVLDAELQQVKLRGNLLAQIAEATSGRVALERAFELIAETLMSKPDYLRLLQFSALELGEDIDPLLRKTPGPVGRGGCSLPRPMGRQRRDPWRYRQSRRSHPDFNRRKLLLLASPLLERRVQFRWNAQGLRGSLRNLHRSKTFNPQSWP